MIDIERINKLLIFRKFRSPLYQFLAALCVNLFIFTILYSNTTTNFNMHAPYGKFSENIWHGSDVWTYVSPAENFLKTGTFGFGERPDAHRTIGYPLFIAAVMKLFGDSWNIAMLFIQAILYSFIFPVLFFLIRLFFPDEDDLPVYSFLMMLFLGSYLSYSQVIYTDCMFALFFTSGILFGILSVVRRSWFFFFLQLVFIGYASLLRPTLALFPVVNASLLVYFSLRHHNSVQGKSRIMIIVSSLVLVFLCNISSVRNYINYGVFIATDVGHNNVFRYLPKRIMNETGRGDEFKKVYAEADFLSNSMYREGIERKEASEILRKAVDFKFNYGKEVIFEHPFIAAKWFLAYASYNIFDYHWATLFHYWGYHWHKLNKINDISYASIALLIFFGIFNLIIYFYFIRYIFALVKTRQWLLISGLFLIFLPLLLSFGFGGGARMRLPVEWFIIAAALYQILKERKKTA